MIVPCCAFCSRSDAGLSSCCQTALLLPLAAAQLQDCPSFPATKYRSPGELADAIICAGCRVVQVGKAWHVCVWLCLCKGTP